MPSKYVVFLHPEDQDFDMLLEIMGVEVQYIPQLQMTTLKSEPTAGSLPPKSLP